MKITTKSQAQKRQEQIRKNAKHGLFNNTMMKNDLVGSELEKEYFPTLEAYEQWLIETEQATAEEIENREIDTWAQWNYKTYCTWMNMIWMTVEDFDPWRN